MCRQGQGRSLGEVGGDELHGLIGRNSATDLLPPRTARLMQPKTTEVPSAVGAGRQASRRRTGDTGPRAVSPLRHDLPADLCPDRLGSVHGSSPCGVREACSTNRGEGRVSNRDVHHRLPCDAVLRTDCGTLTTTGGVFASGVGAPQPPSARAYGGVAVRESRAGRCPSRTAVGRPPARSPAQRPPVIAVGREQTAEFAEAHPWQPGRGSHAHPPFTCRAPHRRTGRIALGCVDTAPHAR